MARNLGQLRAEREELAEQARSLNNKYPADVRMPKDESDQLDQLLSKIAAIDLEMSSGQSRANAMAAGGDEWNNGGVRVRAMRTPADFRAHYASNSTTRGEKPNIADFVRGVAGMPTTDAVRASLAIGTDTSGGYLVPGLVMPKILEAMVNTSAVLSAGAGIVPLVEGAKTYTQVAIDNIPTAAWRAENGAVAESDPTFRAVVATPRSLAFYFKVSRELLADGANIESALIVAIAQSFARELDRVALLGSGTAPEPRGLKNTTNVLSVANGANGAALSSYANIFSALQATLQVDAPLSTAAIMSPRSLVKLGGLTDSTGQPLQKPDMLKEMQFLATSQVPNTLTVGTSADCSEIYVGDFTRMVFMMREFMSIQKLDQAFATTGQIAFIGHVRADIAVQYPKAFAVVSGVRP